MQNNTNRILTICLLALFITIITYGARGAAKVQGPQNVLVTNGTSQPVPVGIQGTPVMNAKQYGAWSATIAGNVRVTNTNSIPIPVAGMIEKLPFRQTLTLGTTDGAYGSNLNVVTVPAGRRLIIDYLDDQSNSAVS